MIKMYGKPNCPSCAKAKTLLEQMNIPYEYVDIFANDAALEMIVEQGFKTVPQFFQDGKSIGTFQDLQEHFLLLG